MPHGCLSVLLCCHARFTCLPSSLPASLGRQTPWYATIHTWAHVCEGGREGGAKPFTPLPGVYPSHVKGVTAAMLSNALHVLKWHGACWDDGLVGQRDLGGACNAFQCCGVGRVTAPAGCRCLSLQCTATETSQPTLTGLSQPSSRRLWTGKLLKPWANARRGQLHICVHAPARHHKTSNLTVCLMLCHMCFHLTSSGCEASNGIHALKLAMYWVTYSSTSASPLHASLPAVA